MSQEISCAIDLTLPEKCSRACLPIEDGLLLRQRESLTLHEFIPNTHMLTEMSVSGLKIVSVNSISFKN